MRILVVDDDILSAEMITLVLEDAGYTVVSAENGVMAAEILNTQPAIDMIISDMHMPLVSGIELFRELREQGLNLPFILLTGDEPAGLLAEEPRLDACILKDFNLGESLPQVIAELQRPEPKV